MIYQLVGLSIALIIYFFFGWVLSYKTDKYAWIDFFWASSFILVISFVNWWYSNPSLITLSFIMGIWSLRLSGLLFKRIRNENEDPRYKTLKAHWGAKSSKYFLLLYLFEGVLTLFLCIPLYMNALAADTSMNTWNYIGIGMFFFSILGETISDSQLSIFKREHTGQRKVCNVGLWKYSRHPNYFFEIVIWLSYGFYGLSLANPLLNFIPFIIMFVFITRITGIPYAEKQALLSKGSLYKEYQETTNALFPWFPKENK